MPIPTTAGRTELAPCLAKAFKNELAGLVLGADVPVSNERHQHTRVLAIHNIPGGLDTPIGSVEFTAARGPHGTVPLRILTPTKHNGGALVYIHGGGYNVGSADEFERGLRVVAETSNAVIVIPDYRLAPEWKYPTQLDEYEFVIDWLRTEKGEKRGIKPDLIVGAGDSAGGNMTAVMALRMADKGKPPLRGQMLLYGEARLPFGTKAADENATGYYVSINGLFKLAGNYLPPDANPVSRYISPGAQSVSDLGNLPPAIVYTCGFDPLRDVGVEYAHKLEKAGNEVEWVHHPDLSHGFLQFGWCSEACEKATIGVGEGLKRLIEGKK